MHIYQRKLRIIFFFKMDFNYNKIKLFRNELKLILILILNTFLMGKNQIIFKKFIKFSSFFLFQKLYIYKGNIFRNIYVNKFLLKQRCGLITFTRKPFKFIIKSKITTKLKR